MRWQVLTPFILLLPLLAPVMDGGGGSDGSVIVLFDLTGEGINARGGDIEWGEWERVFDPTPGAPMVPWFATTITLKGRVSVGSFRMSEGKRIAPGDIPTMPDAVSPYEPSEPYGRWDGSTYPSEHFRLRHIGWEWRDGERFDVHSLWITPFSLGPDGAGSSTRAEMEITVAPSSPAGRSGDPSSVPGTASLGPFVEVPPEYLIVADASLVGTLEPLADHRTLTGLPSSVVSVQDIVSEYSGYGDPADAIRDYLRDTLDAYGELEYVLLAGDWSTVPTKRVLDSDPFPGWDDGWIPADSYYSCLDGTWDLDGDGVYGEVGDMEDIIPDISVSRIAIDDPDIWSDRIDLMRSYDLGEMEMSLSERAVLVAAHTHSEGDGTTHSEYLWDKYLDDIYSDKVELYESEMDLTIDAVDSALSTGCSFVQFVDHGGPDVWCDDYGRGVVYRARDASGLENGPAMPVVSTLACLTTWFDDTSGSPQRFGECIAEAFTENREGGALGYIGSSRTSVGILGANTYLPYDNGLQEDMARQIGSGEDVLGDLFTQGKLHYAEVWGGQFANPGNPEVSLCWLEFTLLGEPAARIWTGAPVSLSVSEVHDNDLDPHVVVTVRDALGSPVEGANVTLENLEMGVYSRGSTGPDGIAEFDLSPRWFCDVNLTVTKREAVPYMSNLRIVDNIPPRSVLYTDPASPDGENGWFHTRPNVTIMPDEEGIVHLRIGSRTMPELNLSNAFTFGLEEEGSHSIHYFAEDVAHNLEGENHATISIDLFPPELTSSLVPPVPDGRDGTYISEPQVVLSSPQDGGSTVQVMYSIDGDRYEGYDGPFYVPHGDHTVSAYAIDGSGWTSNTTAFNVSVDTDPPDSSHRLSPSHPDGDGGFYRTRPMLEISSPEEGSVLEYRLDQRDPFVRYAVPILLPDGTHTLQYRAVDMAGNTGPVRSIPIKVDSLAPTLAVTVDPDAPDGENGHHVTAPTLRITVSDNLGAEASYRMDGGQWGPCPGILTIPEGEHEVTILARDGAGSVSDTFQMAFKVDTVPPVSVLDVSGALSGDIYRGIPIVVLSADEPSTLEYTFGSVFSEYDGSVIFPSEEGAFTLRHRARDTAGNEGPTGILYISVDARAPVLDVKLEEDGKGRFTLDMSGTTDGFRVEYRITDGGNVLSDWSTVPVREISAAPGIHDIVVEARDQAGNVASTSLVLEVEDYTWIWLLGSVIVLTVVVMISLLVWNHRRKPPVVDLTPSYGHGVVEAEVFE